MNSPDGRELGGLLPTHPVPDAVQETVFTVFVEDQRKKVFGGGGSVQVILAVPHRSAENVRVGSGGGSTVTGAVFVVDPQILLQVRV